MRNYLLIGFLVILNAPAFAAEPRQSCPRIRAEIAAQTGVLAKPNTDLLRQLSGRPDCAFTASEAYRAALGDTPVARSEAGESGSEQRREHDDD